MKSIQSSNNSANSHKMEIAESPLCTAKSKCCNSTVLTRATRTFWFDSNTLLRICNQSPSAHRSKLTISVTSKHSYSKIHSWFKLWTRVHLSPWLWWIRTRTKFCTLRCSPSTNSWICLISVAVSIRSGSQTHNKTVKSLAASKSGMRLVMDSRDAWMPKRTKSKERSNACSRSRCTWTKSQVPSAVSIRALTS